MRKVHRGIARRAVCILAFVVAGCADDPMGPEVVPDDVDPKVASFVTLMNDHRTTVGCGPLAWADDVAVVATAHSDDMIEREYFAHTNPDGDSPFDRLRDAGIDYASAAENIAYGYPSAEAVLDAWIDSPGHRANIENCGLAEHGVGLVGTHWTHVFVTR